MIIKLLTILAVLGIFGRVSAADPRIIEVSGNGNRVNASIEFFADDGTTLEMAVMDAQRFDWFTVPTNATTYRIKVGGVSSEKIALPVDGHEFVSIRGLSTEKRPNGATVVSLDLESGAVDSAHAGLEGVVYFGQLKAPFGQDNTWNSLYMVTKDNKEKPDKRNAGTKQAVENAVVGMEMFVDFPLHLRQWDESNNRPIKGEDDPVIRAGQIVHVTSLTRPDSRGNVYAKIEVR